MTDSKPTAMEMEEMESKVLLQSIADTKDGGTRYAFLLGAGASVSSGIPGAKELATDWLQQIKEDNPDAYQKLTKRDDYDLENIAALYSEVYRVRFPISGAGYRVIEKIMDNKKVWPSIGYSILAQVMTKTRHNLVLTTNFDRLTETALLSYQNIHARVIAHESMLDVTVMDDQHPSIAKIHGDMLFSPKSTEEDLKKLAGKWPDIIKKILGQYHVIAIGHGGNDGGLMKVLNEALKETPEARIYWCHLGEQLDKFQKLPVKQVISVKIPSFDKMMYVLGEKLVYPLLSDQIIEVAEKRKQAYEDQIAKLIEEPKRGDDKEVTEAITKLVANTWGEVQLKVQETNEPDEKEALYRKGLEEFSDSHELLSNFALFLTHTRKYDEAEKHYKKALEADSNNVVVNVNYAGFLKDIRKKYDEAEKHYKKALAVDPANVDINGGYALFLEGIRKNYDEAEKYYKKALEADSNNVVVNGNYAGLLLAEGRKDEAEKHYKKALEADSDNVVVNVNYAGFLKDIRKKYDEAEKHYKKALEADSNNVVVNVNYAGFLKDIRKKYDEAEKYYKKALEADSNNVFVNVNYALFLKDIRKKYDEAEKHYKKALEADSKGGLN